jgi:hypothetical protein
MLTTHHPVISAELLKNFSGEKKMNTADKSQKTLLFTVDNTQLVVYLYMDTNCGNHFDIKKYQTKSPPYQIVKTHS